MQRQWHKIWIWSTSVGMSVSSVVCQSYIFEIDADATVTFPLFLWRQLAVQCLRWLGQSCWAIRLLGLIEVAAAATSDVAAASVRLTFCLCWHLIVNYFISLLRLEKHKQTHFDLNDMIGTTLRPTGQPHAENMVTQLVSSVQRLLWWGGMFHQGGESTGIWIY